MFGVSDLAEVVATRKDRFVGNTCPVAVSSASYVLFVVKFLFFFLISVVYSCYFMCYRISVNKDVCVKRPCDCCVGQFCPKYITGGEYSAPNHIL